MTAEQLEELMVAYEQNDDLRKRHNAHGSLQVLAPSLARRVLAAEKLVEAVSALIERDIAHVGPFAGQRVIAARAALTTYRAITP